MTNTALGGKTLCKRQVAVGLGLVLGVLTSAYAATIQYTATQTLIGTLTLTEDTTLEVASGAVVTCQGPVEGAYKLTKTGAGELVLDTANAFGSLVVDEGVVRANGPGSLGNGPVTIVGSTTATCRLDFGVMSAATTFANHFVVENSSSSTYPAVRFMTGTGGKTITFTGSWTAYGNLYFEEWCNNAPQSTIFYTFDCPVDAGANILRFSAASKISWKGRVTAEIFEAYGGAGSKSTDGSFVSGYWRGTHDFHTQNSIGELKSTYNGVSVRGRDALGGIINLSKAYASSSSVRGNITFEADDTLAALVSPSQQKNGDTGNLIINTGSQAIELTVTGTPATVTQTCWIKMTGASSLTLDAFDGFTQCIIGRTHTTTGFLTVRRGTLSLEGETSFGSVQAVKVTGGMLDCQTTSANCFAGITNLAIAASGSLNFAATAEAPVPDDGSLDFEIATGSVLTLAQPMIWHVRRFVVDGVCKGIGTWTSSNCPALPANLTVVSAMADQGAIEAISWHGGTDGFSTAANWGRKGAPLDLTGNEYVATFADEDAQTREAVVEGPVALHGLVFAGPSFGLRTGDESASLSVFEGLVAFADDVEANTEAHAYTNDVPLLFFEDASIVVPAADSLVLGDVRTNKGLDFTGRGTTYLCGDILVDGPMDICNGRVHLRGTIAATDHVLQSYGADCYLNLNYDVPEMADLRYSLVLDGGTIEKPIHAKAHAGGDTVLLTTANSTNLITGELRTDSPLARITVASGSELTMAGGEVFGWSMRKYGTGVLVITNKPLVVGNSSAQFSVYEGTLRFDVEGNSAASAFEVRENGRVEMTVDNACATPLVLYNGSTVDFGETQQRISYLRCMNASYPKGGLSGGYGSCLTFTTGLAAPIGVTNVSCRVLGGLSLAMGGTGRVVLTNQVFASCGDLSATNGVLELAADASWLNGTNFTAKGNGTLRFNGSRQISGDFARLHFAEGGTIEIPSGVTVRVAEADIDGRAIHGTYATGQLDGRVTGGGTLQVGPGGLLVIFK